MGRKSNKKKNKSKAKAKEQDKKKLSVPKKQSKKLKKEPKQKVPKAPKEKTPSNIPKQRILGFFLTLIMAGLLIVAGYGLAQKAFKASPIAKILPAEQTALILELNSSSDHRQAVKTFNLLKNYPEYSQENLNQLIAQPLGQDFTTEIEPWLGRQVGVAVITGEESPINLVYFAELFSTTSANQLIKKQHNETINNYKIYQTENGKYLTIIQDYLFLSETKQPLVDIIASHTERSPSILNEPEYSKITNNLPFNQFAFLYLNFNKIGDGLFQAFPILAENGISAEALAPFLTIFQAEGASLAATEDHFEITSFLKLDPSQLNQDKFLTLDKKYTAQLTKYVPANTLAFWGSRNLEYQFEKILELFAAGDTATIKIFKGIIQSYAQKYFGSDINFQNNIIALLSQEFAVSIEKHNEKITYKFLFELENPQQDAFKVQELANNFATIGALFEPKIVEHTLEDGTVSKELIAIPEEIIKSETSYKDILIYKLQFGQEEDQGIYYAFINNITILTNNEDAIKATIDLQGIPENSLNASPIFASSMQPILSNSDEIAYVDVDALLPIYLQPEQITPPLNLIDFLTSGKNYFNDGIISTTYIHIK